MAIDFTLEPELEEIRLRVRAFVNEVFKLQSPASAAAQTPAAVNRKRCTGENGPSGGGVTPVSGGVKNWRGTYWEGKWGTKYDG